MRGIKGIPVAAAVCAAVFLAGCAPKAEEQFDTFFAMSTVVSVTAYGDAAERGIEAAEDTAAHYEALFSVTNENSDVSRINAGAGEPVKVDLDTAALVFRALEMCERTGGSLDISVYPIVRAWGFTRDSYRVPEPEELAELLKNVDFSRVFADNIESTVTLPQGAEIDLGAVAKGYIGDRMSQALREAGVESAIINLGGNVQTVGVKPDGALWKIAVRDPQDPSEHLGVVTIGEGAVVTSGAYERYFIEGGNTYHHIIDPATGRPAQSGLQSVTIVSEGAGSGFYADALSTAMFVMGAEAALELWERLGGQLGGMSFDIILVTDTGETIITPGLESSFDFTADSSYALSQRSAP